MGKRKVNISESENKVMFPRMQVDKETNCDDGRSNAASEYHRDPAWPLLITLYHTDHCMATIIII